MIEIYDTPSTVNERGPNRPIQFWRSDVVRGRCVFAPGPAILDKRVYWSSASGNSAFPVNQFAIVAATCSLVRRHVSSQIIVGISTCSEHTRNAGLGTREPI